MPKYVVDIQEVWVRSVIVEAESVEDAREAALDSVRMEASDTAKESFEYSHIVDIDEWNVEDITNQK